MWFARGPIVHHRCETHAVYQLEHLNKNEGKKHYIKCETLQQRYKYQFTDNILWIYSVVANVLIQR